MKITTVLMSSLVAFAAHVGQVSADISTSAAVASASSSASSSSSAQGGSGVATIERGAVSNNVGVVVRGPELTNVGNSSIAAGAVTTNTSTLNLASGGSGGSVSTSGNSESSNTNSVNVVEAAIPTETTANINYSGKYTVRNTPIIAGIPLTSANDTCMGSTSGGVAVAGFGLNVGSTWTDPNCKMLKNARELYNMGFPAAAMARLCMDAENLEAFELVGMKCPQSK